MIPTMRNKLINLFGVFLLSFLLASCASARRHHNEESFYFDDYSMAEQLYEQGAYDRAIQRYQAYIDENPEGNLAVIAQYYIAKSHMALGRIDEAKSIFQKIMKEHPDMVWANFSETQIKELEKAPKPAATS